MRVVFVMVMIIVGCVDCIEKEGGKKSVIIKEI